MKNEKMANLYILNILLYIYCFVGGYNSKTTRDSKLKCSSFLSCVEVNKCVKFQIPTVGIFLIMPIQGYSKCKMHLE